MIGLETRRELFVLRPGRGAQSIGRQWPAGAIADFKSHRSAVVHEDGAYEIQDGRRDDPLRRAIELVSRGGAKRAMVARVVGRFGDLPLYESREVVVKDPLPGAADPGAAGILKMVGLLETKQAKDTKDVTITGMASTPDLDRDFDVVEPTAFKDSLEAFAKNPMLLFNHGFNVMFPGPIGRVDEVEVRESRGLWIRATISDEQVKEWLRKGLLNTFSVQFRIHDREFRDAQFDQRGAMTSPPVRVIKKAELLEVSVVTIPANNAALIETVKSAGGSTERWRAEHDATACLLPAGVVEHRDLPPAGPEDPWDDDLGLIRKELGDEAVRVAHSLDMPALDLQHAGLCGGDLKAVPSLVRIAMARVLDRSLDLHDEQHAAVHASLAARWRQVIPDEPAPALDTHPAPGLFRRTVEGKAEATTKVQTVICSKERFKKVEDARKWCEDHDFHAGKVDETDTSFRFRQFEPSKCKEDSERTITLDKGVKAVACRMKDGKCAAPASVKASAAGREEEPMQMMKEAVEALVKEAVAAALKSTDPAATGATPATGGTTPPVAATVPAGGEVGSDKVAVDAADLALLEAAARGGSVADGAALEQAARRLATATGLV